MVGAAALVAAGMVFVGALVAPGGGVFVPKVTTGGRSEVDVPDGIVFGPLAWGGCGVVFACNADCGTVVLGIMGVLVGMYGT